MMVAAASRKLVANHERFIPFRFGQEFTAADIGMPGPLLREYVQGGILEVTFKGIASKGLVNRYRMRPGSCRRVSDLQADDELIAWLEEVAWYRLQEARADARDFVEAAAERCVWFDEPPAICGRCLYRPGCIYSVESLDLVEVP